MDIINLRAGAGAGAGAALKPRMRKDGLNIGKALLWVGREHGLAGNDGAFVHECVCGGGGGTNGGMRKERTETTATEFGPCAPSCSRIQSSARSVSVDGHSYNGDC